MGTAIAAAYYTVVGAFIVFAVVNIASQIWTRTRVASSPDTCEAGLLDLVRAVERARAAASTSPSDDEAVALGRFRRALDPEWQAYEGIARVCRQHASWAPSLDLVQRLRYAEARATRRDAAELSPLRRKVDELVATQLRRSH